MGRHDSSFVSCFVYFLFELTWSKWALPNRSKTNERHCLRFHYECRSIYDHQLRCSRWKALLAANWCSCSEEARQQKIFVKRRHHQQSCEATTTCKASRSTNLWSPVKKMALVSVKDGRCALTRAWWGQRCVNSGRVSNLIELPCWELGLRSRKTLLRPAACKAGKDDCHL